MSRKAGSYSGVFTVVRLLSGIGRHHHSEILAAATKVAEAGSVVPIFDPRVFDLETVNNAHRTLKAKENRGKLVVAMRAPSSA